MESNKGTLRRLVRRLWNVNEERREEMDLIWPAFIAFAAAGRAAPNQLQSRYAVTGKLQNDSLILANNTAIATTLKLCLPDATARNIYLVWSFSSATSDRGLILL